MTKSIYTFSAIRLAPHFIVPEGLVDGNLGRSDCYQNLKLYVSSSSLNSFIHHFKALSEFQIKHFGSNVMFNSVLKPKSYSGL